MIAIHCAPAAHATAPRGIELQNYAQAIAEHVSRKIIEPCGGIDPGTAHYTVTLRDNGAVARVRLEQRSLLQAWDLAVHRAIIMASPMPLPKDPELRKQFETIELRISPAKTLPPSPTH